MTIAALKVIDVFSGCGGMTLGFAGMSRGSFESVWANDWNEPAVESYNANFGNHCVAGNILDILADPNTTIPKADVVIGGPPCQGFSLLNKARNSDARKQLWRPFLEVVRRSRASIFVMENVPQLLGSSEFGQIEIECRRLGFSIAAAKLCAADYGVPQTRVRAIIMGCAFADPNDFFPPRKTHHNPGKSMAPDSSKSSYEPISTDTLQSWVSVRDAIGDLPPPIGSHIHYEAPSFDLHFARNPTQLSQARYRAIPLEGMNRFDLQQIAPELTPDCWIKKRTGGTDLFGRLWWDKPAFTIRTEFFKPEKGRYLHPEQHRPITHREAARLQSFPDDFVFNGNKTEIAKQIGNAVPPLLAACIADTVYDMFLAGGKL